MHSILNQKIKFIFSVLKNILIHILESIKKIVIVQMKLETIYSMSLLLTFSIILTISVRLIKISHNIKLHYLNIIYKCVKFRQLKISIRNINFCNGAKGSISNILLYFYLLNFIKCKCYLIFLNIYSDKFI